MFQIESSTSSSSYNAIHPQVTFCLPCNESFETDTDIDIDAMASMSCGESARAEIHLELDIDLDASFSSRTSPMANALRQQLGSEDSSTTSDEGSLGSNSNNSSQKSRRRSRCLTSPTQASTKTPCRFFHSKKGCRMGSKCRFDHSF